MLAAALIPPFFIDSVVALGVFVNRPGEPDNWVAVATGFFYGVPADAETDPAKRQYRIYLVSNRHVFDGPRQLVARINPEEATEQARAFSILLRDDSGKSLWTGHPDSRIDVAVTAVDPSVLVRERRRTAFFAADQHAADRTKLRSIGMSMGDPVFLLGFPIGIVGAQRNYVIARKGSIARINDVLDGAETTFLIDALGFPGNSGGPVVSAPSTTAITGTQSQDRSYLIGIISQTIDYVDNAISSQTGDIRLRSRQNSGLAVIYPVDYINETIRADLAKEQR